MSILPFQALSSKGNWETPPFTNATINISQAGLINGVNTIGVEVHANSIYAWNARFDLYVSASGAACGSLTTKMIYSTRGLPLKAVSALGL